MENRSSQSNISFSILMASYNLENYIEEAIESVVTQTYPHWEIIIVDDASTDKSIEKIKLFLKDHRIKLFINKRNKGAGHTIKTAADNSSNMVLCVLDCDDKLHKNALEVMAKAYQENQDCGYIYSTHWICDSKLSNQRITNLNVPVDLKKTNLLEFKTSHFKTFKKEAYDQTKGFNPNFKLYCDGDISFKLEEVTKLKFINVPLYYYRKHKGGASLKHRSQVFLENYIAKVNAYHRRLKTDLPNLSIESLYIEYYKCIFFKITLFLTYLKEYFRLNHIFDRILRMFVNIPIKVEKKLGNIKKKYFYWF